MTERTRIGNSAFGTPGMFISQPGDSIASPSQALLLDSRFDALEVHTAGRVTFPEFDFIDPTHVYRRVLSYPSLGYIPLLTWHITLRDEDRMFYPPGVFERDSGVVQYTRSFITSVSNSEIIFEAEIDGGEMALDIAYVIYRNPKTSPSYSPSGTERVFIGNHNGTFKMRVSKPGFVARSANRDQCIIHEDKRPLIPVASGTLNVSTSGATVNLGRSFSIPPKMMCTNAGPAAIMMRLDLNSGQLRFFNNSGSTLATKYIIFAPI